MRRVYYSYMRIHKTTQTKCVTYTVLHTCLLANSSDIKQLEFAKNTQRTIKKLDKRIAVEYQKKKKDNEN